MQLAFLFVLLGCFAQLITAPPVTQKKPEDSHEKDSEVKDHLEDYMEYHRYLKEVVQALESDPEFRAKLEKAQEVDIRTGKIAQELDYVNHNVRTKLDEIKRQELERLRHLATKQFELTNDIDTVHAKISTQVEHVDHNNPHTFEIEDLKKLIQKTTEDLAEADKKRRDEFKEYEMQKEFEQKQKLQGLDDTHRQEYEKEIHDREEKHKKHEPLHHPVSRQQLEEVWEKQDHMDSQDFNPKTFFMLHDVDGNGVWDQNEVKALFLKDLDKMYQNGAPEDDMRERQEEMERMREHVFREADTNRDNLISYEEFLVQTRRDEFEKDQGWKGLDEQQVYTPEEYNTFEHNRLEEIQRLVEKGLLPPQPVYYDGYPGQQYHPNSQGNAGPPHPSYQQNGPGQYQPHPQQQYHNQQYPPQNQQFQGQGHPQGYPQHQGQPQGYPQHQGQPQGYLQHQGQPQGYPQQAHNLPAQLINAQGNIKQGQEVHNAQPQHQAQNQLKAPQEPSHGVPQQAQGHPPNPQIQPQAAQAQVPVPQAQAQVPHNQGQVQHNQGEVQQNQGPVQQNQAQVPQSQGQAPQSQGQVHQGPVSSPVQPPDSQPHVSKS